MNDLTRTVGGRLFRARQSAHLTTRELAAKACVPPSTVNRVERGQEAYFSAVIAISSALGLSLSALVATPTCLTCDGVPPAGFTCQTCGANGQKVPL